MDLDAGSTIRINTAPTLWLPSPLILVVGVCAVWSFVSHFCCPAKIRVLVEVVVSVVAIISSFFFFLIFIFSKNIRP